MFTQLGDLEDKLNHLKNRSNHHPLAGRAFIEYRSGKKFRRGIVQCPIGDDYLFVTIHDWDSDDTRTAVLVSLKEIAAGTWDFYFDLTKWREDTAKLLSEELSNLR
jgi:hypothetical protein